MVSKALFSSNSQDWSTPIDFYISLEKEFYFDCDPCPIGGEDSLFKFDGLKDEWGKVNFVNPPYNKVKDWVKKGFDEYKKGKIVVFLIPARTDTKWFHEYIYMKDYAEIRFIKGRLKFGGSKNSVPFPSMLVIFK